MSNTEAIFIPAPDGTQLAIWHCDNGAELLPLVGWLLDVSGSGEPIVRRGARVKVLRPHDSTYLSVDAPEATYFDLDEWNVKMAARFDQAVKDALLMIKDGLTRGPVRIPDNNHSFGVAADRLLDAGLVEWDKGLNYLSAVVAS